MQVPSDRLYTSIEASIGKLSVEREVLYKVYIISSGSIKLPIHRMSIHFEPKDSHDKYSGRLDG